MHSARELDLYPAIDILAGQAVRLHKGDFAQPTVYASTALEAASRWAEEGARRLHVVDLDGARGLVGSNLSQLREIAGKIELPIQFGGGLRNMDAVHAAFDAGADRIILGTAALSDRPFLIRCLEEYADQVIVSVDSRAGVAAIGGWEEDSGLSTDDALRNLRDLGVSRFVVSDIERDGTLTGPALEQIQAAGELLDDFIYSGGVSALADLEAIAEAAPAALNGVIVGSALFERVFTIGEAHEALAGATRQVGEEPRSDAL